MKKSSLTLLFCTLNAALLIGFAPGLMAQTIWTGATNNDWNTETNWSAGLPGSITPTPTIAADGAVVNMSGPVITRSTVVSGNGTTAPVLNITQNFINAYSAFIVGANATATGYSGVVNHTSGTVSINGTSGTRRLQIGYTGISTGTGNGTYNFGGASETAPVLDVGGSILLGGRPGEKGVLSLSGFGTLNQGSLSTDHFQMSSFNGASTLEVIGGDLSINLANNLILAGSGGGTATLSATLTASGFSTINVGGGVQLDNGAGGLNALFVLNLNGFSGTIGQKITIIDANAAFTGNGVFGNVADGSTISAGGYDFLADYDTVNHDFTLEVSAIPEPGTVGFVGVAIGLLVLLRRRRMLRA